jgi:hypothetical protein
LKIASSLIFSFHYGAKLIRIRDRFFGQILLFYCIAHSPSPRVRDTLPSGWERWNEEMLHFLDDCARHSPAVAQDLELLRSLWPVHE